MSMTNVKKKNYKVDVIIPVYNAFSDLKTCVENILKHTDFNITRVVFVDDKSSDPEVLLYLKEIVNKHRGFFLLENKINMGFSATINNGIVFSKNDILLLNTDTIVTSHWIEKLCCCAYSDSMIGTVTPFSNNATLCSIPNFLEENELPTGFTLEQYARLVETCSTKSYPTISVAVGFCMFIKRRVIDDVGLFDAKTFGKGYGEENDFCNRAIQLGYRNALCDDTYIYHTGTASFASQEKTQLCNEHEKILEQRYPYLMQANREFCRDNPIKSLQQNIELHMALNNGNKNILYLSHRDFREDADDHVGGTQFHVEDLTQKLRNEFNVFVVARDGSFLRLTIYLAKKRFSFKYYIGVPSRRFLFFDDIQKAIYSDILDGFSIDIVHIHHTYQLSLDLFYEAHKRSIPLFFTVHDYFSLCPTIKLVNIKNEFCLSGHSSKCKECLSAKYDVYDGEQYLMTWRKHHLEALELCTSIFAPSKSTKKILVQIFSTLEKKVFIIQHGNKPFPVSAKDVYKRTQSFEKSPMNIAFIGGMTVEKGSSLACEIIRNGSSNLNWFVFGGIGDKELVSLNKRNLTKIGWYKREDLPELITRYHIDLICILPIWPETYCYTLSEALMLNVPILATEMGAVGERMQEEKFGWSVSSDTNSTLVLSKINFICNHPEEYFNKVKAIQRNTLKNIDEMASEYLAHYKKNEISKIIFPLSESTMRSHYYAYYMASPDIVAPLCRKTNSETVSEVAYFYELERIKATLSYKFSERIKRTSLFQRIGHRLYCNVRKWF